jgi:diguanylate cyclase (GGDEF)-like protein
MSGVVVDDARSTGPVERLLEDSWQTRSRRVTPREFAVETVAAALFLICALPLAISGAASHPIDVPLCAALVLMYAVASRMIKFPIGAGYVVPSYLVLVPMLLLLPPGIVPVLTAFALMLGTAVQVAFKRAETERIVCAIPDAWHALGPALVLVLAGPLHGVPQLTLVYTGAFLAGCVVDLISATVRESAILGIGSRVQIRVIALVWLIDACVAPLGVLVAHAVRQDAAEIVLLLPLNGLLLLMSRDRNTRIEQAQRRLELVARERTRLQHAVGRLGEALAAKLDLEALTGIVLRGSVEALDADAGRLVLSGPVAPLNIDIGTSEDTAPALTAAAEGLERTRRPSRLVRNDVWALSLPFDFTSASGGASGSLTVARHGREFRPDEEEVMQDLVDRARQAAADIVAHQTLREQALTDTLTGLGNRRRLAADVAERTVHASADRPLVLILLDLDGFKNYNDTFGHLAGDAVLARLGSKLASAVTANGSAYRLGGDEFCVLIDTRPEDLHASISTAAAALEERGENFAIGASYGAVLLPHEASTLDYALRLADERMYERKRSRPSNAGEQTRDVLMHIIRAKQPSLEDHSDAVATLCLRVGRRLGMTPEQLDELAHAAELHDVGKVGIPDAILDKPDKLNALEWEVIHQHTVLGERILSAAPALRPIAAIVRATHERWDGTGYPDRLSREAIPLAARIIAACDAFEAMTSDRCYRGRMAHHDACTEMRAQSAKQFDPSVVDALLEETVADVATLQASDNTEMIPGDSAAREVAEQLLEVIASKADIVAGELTIFRAGAASSHPSSPDAH